MTSTGSARVSYLPSSSCTCGGKCGNKNTAPAVGKKPRSVAADPINTLNSVARIVGERQAQYGSPADHWSDTAAIASVLLSEKLTEPLSAGDWAKLMVVDKLVRDKRGPQFDNAADIAGYALGLAGLPERR